MDLFVKKLEFEVVDKVIYKVQQFLYQSANSKRRWHEPFTAQHIFEGNYMQIWYDTLGMMNVKSLELKIMEEHEEDDIIKKEKPDENRLKGEP